LISYSKQIANLNTFLLLLLIRVNYFPLENMERHFALHVSKIECAAVILLTMGKMRHLLNRIPTSTEEVK